MLARLRRLLRDRAGIMLAEVAMTLPIVAALALGTVEVTGYIILKQKLDRAAVTMADLVSREELVTNAFLTTAFDAIAHVVSPYPMGPRGIVIVSGVSRGAVGAARVDWQQAGAGAKVVTSGVGAPGTDAVLPDGFIVRAGEGVIVVEVVYDFEPRWLPALFPPATLSQRALFRPRFSPTPVLS